MSDDKPETPEQRIAKIDAWIETLKKDREQTMAKIPGHGAAPSATERISQEEKDAETWNRLSPGELMQLYQTNRDEWQRLIDAVEKVGLRKLMRSR